MGHDELLTPNFVLRELLPVGFDGEVPAEVRASLQELAENILEPARSLVGVPLRVTSGWRLPGRNEKVGGAKGSDHLTGRAADLQALAGEGRTWEANTERLFHAIRVGLEGAYGQVIWEDRRRSLANPGKLCVHVSLPSARHPGYGGDVNMVLVSYAPKSYRQFEPEDVA